METIPISLVVSRVKKQKFSLFQTRSSRVYSRVIRERERTRCSVARQSFSRLGPTSSCRALSPHRGGTCWILERVHRQQKHNRERRGHKSRGLITLIHRPLYPPYFWGEHRCARSREHRGENTDLIALWSGTRASPLPNACSRVKSLSGLHNGSIPASSWGTFLCFQSWTRCNYVSENWWKLLGFDVWRERERIKRRCFNLGRIGKEISKMA